MKHDPFAVMNLAGANVLVGWPFTKRSYQRVVLTMTEDQKMVKGHGGYP